MNYSIVAGTNSGQAFGQLGIGVYGKRFFRKRGSKLHVEFKYRARATQKKVQRIQLSVPIEHPTAADGVIRQWLVEKHSLGKRKGDNKCIGTLFGRIIDNDVKAIAFVEFQNQRKKGKRSRPVNTAKIPQPTPSTAMTKLQNARYRDQVRKRRVNERLVAQRQVLFSVLFYLPIFILLIHILSYIINNNRLPPRVHITDPRCVRT